MSDTAGLAADTPAAVSGPRLDSDSGGSDNRSRRGATPRYGLDQVVRTSIPVDIMGHLHPAGSRVCITQTWISEGAAVDLAPYDYAGVFLDTNVAYAFTEDELANDWGAAEREKPWSNYMRSDEGQFWHQLEAGEYVSAIDDTAQQVWDYVRGGADGEAPFEAAVHALYGEAEQILLRKHAMYGEKNVAQAPGGPLNGLRVRIWDKVARLNNLTEKGIDQPDFESLRDTFLDLANYALIGCLVLDGNWPGA